MARGLSKQYKRLRDEVARLALVHRTVPAILDALMVDAERLAIDADDLPDPRTIGRWLKDIRTRDTSGPWTPLTAADPGQAARVLPVLAEALRSGGEERWLTHDLAALIDRVVLAKPNIPPHWAWALARAYQWARENESDTRGLDLTLALEPWYRVQAATEWAGLLRKMGERAGGWPGGGPGLLALAAWLPPPDWASDKHDKHYWGAQLWQILTEETDGVTTADGEPIDSKLTAKPLDDGGQSETDTHDNRRERRDFGWE